MHATAAIRSERKPGIIRRYCSCASLRLCTCSLPAPRSGWSIERLERLRQVMREHGSLAIAAAAVDETLQRANIALEALLGRTPEQAMAALEARASRERYETDRLSALAQSTMTVAELLASIGGRA